MKTAENLYEIVSTAITALIDVANHDTSKVGDHASNIYQMVYSLMMSKQAEEALAIFNGDHYINKLIGSVSGTVPRIDESFIDEKLIWREGIHGEIDQTYLYSLLYLFNTKATDEFTYNTDGYLVKLNLLDDNLITFTYCSPEHGELYKWGHRVNGDGATINGNSATACTATFYTTNKPLMFTPKHEKQHEIIESIIYQQTGYKIDHDIKKLYDNVISKLMEAYTVDDLPVTIINNEHLLLELISYHDKVELSLTAESTCSINQCILHEVLTTLDV